MPRFPIYCPCNSLIINKYYAPKHIQTDKHQEKLFNFINEKLFLFYLKRKKIKKILENFICKDLAGIIIDYYQSDCKICSFYVDHEICLGCLHNALNQLI